MLAGQTIASITIMRGTMNKNDPSKDITLEQVVASEYTQGVSSSLNRESGQYESNDYVEAAPRNFYMNWVRSFVI
jgi:hypothetical protein